MVLPDDNHDMPATPKDQEIIAQGRKTTRPAPEQGVKCPRCDSPNTKFCYYNNYSLTQPRHFCKTCRRYWTNGGALRNVPIGGGCRKNKKVKSLSSSSSSSSSRLSYDSKDFQFHRLSVPPSLDFHLGGLGLPLHHSPTPATTALFNQFSSFGDLSATTSSLSGFQLDPPGPPATSSNSLMGLVPPNTEPWGLGLSQSSTLSDPLNGALQMQMQMQSMDVHSSLASSIESLSNLNQDLHLKLQQQRLAMMFGGDSQKVGDNGVSLAQPVLFQNLEIPQQEGLPAGSSVKEGSTAETGVTPTEWFFGHPFSSVNPTSHGANNGNQNNDVNNDWSGVHGWGDLQQQPFSALP